ncbi:MAG: cytochrome c family protein [Pseudomonadota bacterium]
MGDLFWNKVAGALLALFLIVMGLQTVADMVYSDEAPETIAYPIDLSILEGSATTEAEEEGPVDFGLLLAAADLSAGERVVRRCVSCHTLGEGGADGTGPHMWGVMGRAVAAVDGFNYSSAMQDYSEDSSVVWGYQNMYDYLENPRRYVPGTAMSFAGLRNQEDRINIIAFLRTLDRNPMALPDPLPVEAPAELVDTAMAEGAQGESDLAAFADAAEAAIDDAAAQGEALIEGADEAIEGATDAAQNLAEDAVEAVGNAADDAPTEEDEG